MMARRLTGSAFCDSPENASSSPSLRIQASSVVRATAGAKTEIRQCVGRHVRAVVDPRLADHPDELVDPGDVVVTVEVVGAGLGHAEPQHVVHDVAGDDDDGRLLRSA